MRYSFSSFLLITFSVINAVFFDIFCIKCSHNFFTFEIANDICPRNKTLISVISFRPIWNVTFCKNVFTLWYPYMITNFELRIFFVILPIEINICPSLYINRLHFGCAIISIIEFINCTIQFIYICTAFDTEVICLEILFFKILITFSGITDSLSLCVEYISIPHLLQIIYLKNLLKTF